MSQTISASLEFNESDTVYLPSNLGDIINVSKSTGLCKPFTRADWMIYTHVKYSSK